MDAMESRLHRLNAMTRSEIIPARMLQASSVNELQTMRMNETAGKRLTRDIDALSRRELMEIGDVAAEQQRTRKDAARMKNDAEGLRRRRVDGDVPTSGRAGEGGGEEADQG